MNKFTFTFETDSAAELTTATQAVAWALKGTPAHLTAPLETKVAEPVETKVAEPVETKAEAPIETKVETKATKPKAAPKAKVEPVEAAPEAEVAAETTGVTKEALYDKFIEVGSRHGKAAAVAVLNKLGVNKIHELHEDQYEEAYAQAELALGA